MVGNNFDDWLLFALYKAYLEARKGKRTTADEYKFEVGGEMENLIKLRDAILERNYHPRSGIAFITRRPVPREIFAASFPDRIIHHLLFNEAEKWWNPRLDPNSYSCRKGKGTWAGVKDMRDHIRAVSEDYTREAYVIKLDIQGYFMSLVRTRLMERVDWGLRQQYTNDPAMYDLMEYIWRQVIFDDPIDGVKIRGQASDWAILPPSKSLFCQPEGQGIVIGNLTSQHLSNIYLDQLDRYIRYTLGYKYFGRYVDDFYFVVTEDELLQAKRNIRAIESFLKSIGLVLHPKKRYIQNVRHGVAFLGVVLYPGFIVPGKRFKKQFYQAAQAVQMGRKSPDAVTSYIGFLKHIRGEKLIQKVFADMGWEYYPGSKPWGSCLPGDGKVAEV